MSTVLRGSRGITLTEVAVTMIIGTMIMAGLVGFYISSQGLWLDASTQVISQREATLVLEAIRDSIRSSGKADALDSPDATHQLLALYKNRTDPAPSYYFYWNRADSLIYAGTSVGGVSAGPMVYSRAERLQFVANNTNGGVQLNLRLRSSNGQTVEYTSFAGMRNLN